MSRKKNKPKVKQRTTSRITNKNINSPKTISNPSDSPETVGHKLKGVGREFLSQIFSPIEINMKEQTKTNQDDRIRKFEEYLNELLYQNSQDIYNNISSKLTIQRTDTINDFKNVFSDEKLKIIFEKLLASKDDEIEILNDQNVDLIRENNGYKEELSGSKDDIEREKKKLDNDHKELLEQAERKVTEHFANWQNAKSTINSLKTDLSEKDDENNILIKGLESIEKDNRKINEIFGEINYDIGDQTVLIKNIAFLLIGLEKAREYQENPESAEIFNDQYEVNIALYISSLAAQFGIDTPNFDTLLDGINKHLVKYKIDTPAPIDSPMDPNKHKQINPPNDTFVKKYHSLSITHKSLNTIARKALIEAD